jgi:methionyl-tRNA formyltransferase
MTDKLRVLFLGPQDNYERVRRAFDDDPINEHVGEFVGCFDAPLPDVPAPHLLKYDWVVSFGYRYKVPQWLLDKLPHKCINVHISALPWNRGAHPNLWAFLENTPHGITIHEMDDGLDTGPIIIQAKVQFTLQPSFTFRDTWADLMAYASRMFVESWEGIKAGTYPAPTAQVGKGSCHRVADLATVADCLPQSWDTPIAVAKKLYDQLLELDAGSFDEVAEP